MDVPGVRGSTACAKAITDGHETVGQLLGTAQGRRTLATLFPAAVKSAAWLEASDAHRRDFAGCGVATFPAQGNQPTCSSAGCGVTQICQIMANTTLGRPVERLAALAAAQNGADMTGGCEMDWESNRRTHPNYSAC